MNDAPQSLNALRKLIENAPSADDGAPRAARARIRGHRGGHARLLRHIGQRPLLDFSLRLGEASGAALAAGLVRAAAATHNGMATFERAGVSGPVG